MFFFSMVFLYMVFHSFLLGCSFHGFSMLFLYGFFYVVIVSMFFFGFSTYGFP